MQRSDHRLGLGPANGLKVQNPNFQGCILLLCEQWCWDQLIIWHMSLQYTLEMFALLSNILMGRTELPSPTNPKATSMLRHLQITPRQPITAPNSKPSRNKTKGLTLTSPVTTQKPTTNPSHDDVIKWKHFPRYWPFLRGTHRSRWIPHTKASDAELWCFLWSASE